MFSLIVLILNVRRKKKDAGIQLERAESHLGDPFEYQTVLNCIRRVAPPGKRGVSSHQHAGSIERIHAGQTLQDDAAGLQLISGSHLIFT